MRPSYSRETPTRLSAHAVAHAVTTGGNARPARILIVDDQETNIRLLRRILLGAGYTELASCEDAREVAALFQEFRPDLLLLDLHMPALDGFGVLEVLARYIPADDYLPILMLTGDASSEARRRALAAGVKDFLAKPFDPVEVLLRIRNLLHTRFLHLAVRHQNESLEGKVRERTRELDEARIEILERLAQAAEYRDDDTGRHTRRVGELSARLARALGSAEHAVEVLRRAAPLHDVGKIGIPDAILLKPAKLTDAEFTVMRTHTTIGARILSGGRTELIRTAEHIALSHHERWDGGGYPHGIAGEDIPIEARIVAVADFFDALTHDRPYRKAWSAGEALAEVERQRGRQFDPRVAEALPRLVPAHG